MLLPRFFSVKMLSCFGFALRFCTLKKQLLWVRTFSKDELRRALLEWAHRYNEHWPQERHNFLSPSQTWRELMQKQAARLQPTWCLNNPMRYIIV